MQKTPVHPAVLALKQKEAPVPPPRLPLEELRAIARAAGAHDVSAVSNDHPDLAEEKEHALAAPRGRMKVRGQRALLDRFKACFPR